MLKRRISSDEHAKLATDVAALYTRGDDGQFTLQVEPDPETAKIKEQLAAFRSNNDALARKVDELSKTKTHPSDVGLAERLADVEQKLAASEEARIAVESKNNRAQLERRIADVGERLGLASGAAADMLNRAHAAGFTIRDDAPVAINSDGGMVMRGESPLTLAAWMADQKSGDGKHLFVPPTGLDGVQSRIDGQPTGGGKVVVDPPNDYVVSHMDEIERGEIVVQRSTPEAVAR